MQGAQKLRSEAHLRCAAATKLQRNAADGLFTRSSKFFDRGFHPIFLFELALISSRMMAPALLAPQLVDLSRFLIAGA